MLLAIALLLVAGQAIAQQYSILTSPADPNITISYRRPTAGTCTTVFDSQEQFSGYVNLPPFTLTPFQQNYSINTFFWFFEARLNPDTAPLTIWLNGGPGSSSMIGLFQELGPCEIVLLPNGSYGTQPRLWGWDRSTNLLFIDQPTQTGFSYDERVNASVDYMYGGIQPPQPLPEGVPAWRFHNGTFASGLGSNTQHSTAIAARACWHFLQSFLSAFPQYNPGTRANRTNLEYTGVHLFAESYGGMYGPTFADYFEEQNDHQRSGLLPPSTLEVRLESVGIINGILDRYTNAISFANFTHSNSYGLEVVDSTTYQNTISNLVSNDGCRGLVARCRNSTILFDPEGAGIDETTNKLCGQALSACEDALGEMSLYEDVSLYDIRVTSNIEPPADYQEYLNTPAVMQSIGAQVNYTESSSMILNQFAQIGDSVRGTQFVSLASLLTRGIRVALIYGDADIICNWYSGQNASLTLSHLVPSYASAFPAAGYADIVVNESYVGGQVRQYGNLTFARIYDAGHMVPYYQPETAFTVFSRIIMGVDVSMGKDVDLKTWRTEGEAESLHRNKLPQQEPKHACWIRNAASCSLDEKEAIAKGEGNVVNGIWSPAVASVAPGNGAQKSEVIPLVSKTTTAMTASVPVTGVFIATTVPKSTSGSGRAHEVWFWNRQ